MDAFMLETMPKVENDAAIIDKALKEQFKVCLEMRDMQ